MLAEAVQFEIKDYAVKRSCDNYDAMKYVIVAGIVNCRGYGMPKVSVIVPVYNTEAYIERCIDSLVCQTQEDIEIIIVEDGSGDRTGEICDRYAAQDSRIRVIHKSNEGLSCARNDGIDAALSKYIMFADGDDWVDPRFCEIPYEIATNNDAQLVLFRHRWYVDGMDVTQHHSRFTEGPVTRADAMEMIHDGEIGWMVWNKFYERSLFDTIKFPAGRVHEDIGTVYRLIDKAGKIFYSHAVLYHYTALRPGSITTTINNKKMRDWLDMWSQERNFLREGGYPEFSYFTDEAFELLIQYERAEGLTRDFRRTMKSFARTKDGFNEAQKRLLNIYRWSPHLFCHICNSPERLEKMGIEIE